MFSIPKERIGQWLIKKGQSLQTTQQIQQQSISSRVKELSNFWFLADAPMFIDGAQVERLYEAIFQPEYEAASRTLATGSAKAKELSSELAMVVEASVPTIFKVSGNYKVADKEGTTDSHNESIVETAVKSSERRLEKLIRLYVYSYPERIFRVNHNLTDISRYDVSTKNWVQSSWDTIELCLDEPGIRPFVVFDLGKETKFIPMVTELSNGKIVNLCQNLISASSQGQNTVFPPYPIRGTPNFVSNQQTYWLALSGIFNSLNAMNEVENATNAGVSPARIEWIDYRLVGFKNMIPIPIHLHVVARGQYATGTFAYQTIRRAESVGVRVVGTLKKGADVNVLAIYER